MEMVPLRRCIARRPKGEEVGLYLMLLKGRVVGLEGEGAQEEGIVVR